MVEVVVMWSVVTWLWCGWLWFAAGEVMTMLVVIGDDVVVMCLEWL